MSPQSQKKGVNVKSIQFQVPEGIDPAQVSQAYSLLVSCFSIWNCCMCFIRKRSIVQQSQEVGLCAGWECIMKLEGFQARGLGSNSHTAIC